MKRSFLILSSALLLMLFACGTTSYTFEVPEKIDYSSLQEFKAQAKVAYKNYNLITMQGGYASQERANLDVLYQCENLYNAKCLLSYEGEEYVWQKNYAQYELEQAPIRLAEQKAKEEREERERQTVEKQKQALIAEYVNRCIGFGFEEKAEIATCFQQEVFNERQLAQERLIQQQRLVQQPQLVQEEVPFLLRMLGELALGVSEGYLEKVQHDIMHQNDRRPPIIFNPPKP